MSIGIIFAGSIVGVPLGRGVKRSKMLEPLFVVFVKSRFVVVDEYRSRDVHRIAQQQTLTNAALSDRCVTLIRNIQKAHARRDFERQVLGV
jgi:hypothetical protein